jgi:phospholipid/cholesterol/gamma-HCH transport system permease protein
VHPARVSHQRQQDSSLIIASGEWVLPQATTLDTALRRIVGQTERHIRFLLDDITRIDTAGAWLAARTVRDLEAAGSRVELEGNSRARGLIERALVAAREPIWCTAPRASPIAKIGRSVSHIAAEGWRLLVFLGEVMVKLATGLLRPWRIQWRSVASHVEHAGVDAVPIVVLLSALIGLVLAFQGGQELQKFGAEIFTVDLIGISVLREMGPLISAIIIAGRSGSAFAAQIGTMKLNEEVDALRTIGLDPIAMLVIPRVIALVLVLPMIAFLADLAALAGGAIVTSLVYEIPFSQIIQQFKQAVDPNLLMLGLMKSPVFAFIIAIVGCHNGMEVSGGAASVGERTTRSVVAAIFLVICVNALFSVIFARFGI